MNKIPKPIVEMTSQQYWEEHAAREPLPPMPKPCGDCAVENGFYMEFVDELREQPRDIQIRSAKSWFCHMCRTHACRGALNALKVEV